MGRVDRIKRLSYEVLDKHKSKFNESFTDNKKSLDQVAIIRSKGLKNEVAGYITKFIKTEKREEDAGDRHRAGAHPRRLAGTGKHAVARQGRCPHRPLGGPGRQVRAGLRGERSGQQRPVHGHGEGPQRCLHHPLGRPRRRICPEP